MTHPDDYITTLQNDLDNGACFLDYFLTIGVKPDIFKESFLYKSKIDQLNNDYKETLTPSIISMFPPFEKKSINIDDSVTSHIFPNGYNIIESPKQPEAVLFSLVLDNRFLSAKFPYKYFSCLMIYESIDSYKTLYDIYSKLESNSSQGKLSSSVSQKNQEYSKYYLPKCLAFMSVYPYVNSQGVILNKLYSFTKQSKEINNSISIDKLIENLIIETPAPPRGLYKVYYDVFKKKEDKEKNDEGLIFKPSEINKMPLVDFNLEKVFLLKTEDIIEVVKYLLQEIKLLVFSKDITMLTPVILGFLSFIFPFKYPFQVISILANTQYDFIESISPYVIGINQSYSETFFTDNKICPPMSVVIIDMDKSCIDVISSSLVNAKNSSQKKKILSEEFPDLPKAFRHKLEKKLNKYRDEIQSKKAIESKERYSRIFFSFMIKIMSTYSKYLIFDYGESHKTNGDISSLFNAKEFYSSFSGADKNFYKRLTESQMFMEFIYQRMLPRDNQEKLEVLFFDEKIKEKISKKLFNKNKQNNFVCSELYKQNQTYIVSNARGLSENDIDLLSNETNRQNALLKGQYCKILNNDDIIFTYYIFPSLLTDMLFQANMTQYIIPPDLSKDLEVFNNEILSKANMDSSKHITEMENYIYLSWVHIWGLTFWYHNREEKDYWFTRLIKVLDLIWNHEIELFELLFDVLKEYGDKHMIIKLYAKLIEYRLNPSWKIYSIMNHIDDQISSKLKAMIKSKEDITGGSGFNIKGFKQRTLKDSNDTNVITEEVLFYAYDTCIGIDCQKPYNLFTVSKDFYNMQIEEMWLTCANCHNNILPTLKFKFGLELYNQDVTTCSSGHMESIVLNSPKYMRENLLAISQQEKGHNFNLESFKLKYKKVFWNLIWYFKLMNLEIALMLPYMIKQKTFNIISNFLKFSTANSIQITHNDKTIEVSSETPKTMVRFEEKALIQDNASAFEIIPLSEQVPFSIGTSESNASISVSAYALNTTDMNSCINDNLFADNSFAIDNTSMFSEDNISDNEPKSNKRILNKLKTINENTEDALIINNDDDDNDNIVEENHLSFEQDNEEKELRISDDENNHLWNKNENLIQSNVEYKINYKKSDEEMNIFSSINDTYNENDVL